MFLASIIAGIGSLLANATSSACILWIYDEPECPKELIK